MSNVQCITVVIIPQKATVETINMIQQKILIFTIFTYIDNKWFDSTIGTCVHLAPSESKLLSMLKISTFKQLLVNAITV